MATTPDRNAIHRYDGCVLSPAKEVSRLVLQLKNLSKNGCRRSNFLNYLSLRTRCGEDWIFIYLCGTTEVTQDRNSHTVRQQCLGQAILLLVVLKRRRQIKGTNGQFL